MKALLVRFIFLILALFSLINAEFAYLTGRTQNSVKCAGIIKGDSNKPSNISITFTPVNDQNITIFLLNWNDIEQVGVPRKDGQSPASEKLATICNQETLDEGLCSEIDLGRVIINNKDSRGNGYNFHSPIYNDQLSLARLGMGYTALEHIDYLTLGKDPASWDTYKNKARNTHVSLVDGLKKDQSAQVDITWTEAGVIVMTYTVNATGYYCVDAVSDSEFFGKAVWTNGYGYIPASEHIKLPFYKFMTFVYAAYCLLWAYLSIRVWRDVLPLQHYIWVLIAVMVTNMGLSSVYWEHYNRTGTIDTGLTITMVFFYAARNALSFFLLLVVSLGWGIVRPSLGSTMNKALILFLVHFISGCVYGASGVLKDRNELNNESLLVVLPVSVCMTVYYVWIMKAVIATTRILEQRGQTYKLLLFHRMWYLLLGNIITFILFIISNFITIFLMSNSSMVSRLWRYQWLTFDGWLNLQFFVSFSIILWWWRPTSNNSRYGLEQLAGDESGVWERGPSHDGHVMMLADERDFQLALEEADQVADSFVLQKKVTVNSSDDNEDDRRSSYSSFDRDVFVLDDDEFDNDHDDNRERNNLNDNAGSSNIDGYHQASLSGEHDNYKLRPSKDTR